MALPSSQSLRLKVFGKVALSARAVGWAHGRATATARRGGAWSVRSEKVRPAQPVHRVAGAVGGDGALARRAVIVLAAALQLDLWRHGVAAHVSKHNWYERRHYNRIRRNCTTWRTLNYKHGKTCLNAKYSRCLEIHKS